MSVAVGWRLIVLLCFAIFSSPSLSQPTAKVPRIGVLSVEDAATRSSMVEGFREGLRELGYVEGRSILVEYRWGNGTFESLPGLAAELVNPNVDAIVTVVTSASLAAKSATRTIPIVMIGVADPVGVGLVESVARPGGQCHGDFHAASLHGR